VNGDDAAEEGLGSGDGARLIGLGAVEPAGLDGGAAAGEGAPVDVVEIAEPVGGLLGQPWAGVSGLLSGVDVRVDVASGRVDRPVVAVGPPRLLGFAWTTVDGMRPPIPETREPAGGVLPPYRPDNTRPRTSARACLFKVVPHGSTLNRQALSAPRCVDDGLWDGYYSFCW
jgi:hypothetical protein